MRICRKMKASLLLAMLTPLAWCATEVDDYLEDPDDLDLDELCNDVCSGKDKPVCANNGIMYSERCRYLIAKCKAEYRGKTLELASCENQLSDDHQRQVKTAFSRLEKKGRGISRRRLGYGMRRFFNKRMTKHELRELFNKADTDRNRRIDLHEFVEAVAKMLRYTEKNVKFWFELIDKNGDKIIDATERRKTLKFVGEKVPYGTVKDDYKKTYLDFARTFAG